MHRRLLLILFVSCLCACGGTTSDTPRGGAPDSGAGGSGGQGGGSPDAGTESCSGGPVTFEFTSAGAPAFTRCVGSACSLDWLTLRTASNEPLSISHPCVSDCRVCQSMGCPPFCTLPQRMKPEGERLVWDGRVMNLGMCGQEVTCVNPTCAAPGRYIAKMCASVQSHGDAQMCEPNDGQDCVEVTFDYPAQGVVKATVGPTK